MKIAMIGQKGIPTRYGGIERYVENLSIGLVKLNHKVFVYTRPYYTPKNLKQYKGVKLISLPSIHTKHFDTISHVFFATAHALFQNYDVIHYQNVGPALLSWIPRIFKPQTKIIITFQCLDRKHKKWGFIARFFLRLGELAACKFPHKTICVSKTLQAYCQKKYHQKTEYIPNGASKIISKNPNSKILNQFNLQKNRYFLVTSRLVRHKGIHYLIRAFLKLKTDFKLVIVGASSFTDDYVSELRALAKNDSRIIFAGWQGGVGLACLYKNCYLYVHPSESEGMSFSVLEAMSFSRAVLASNILENRELLEGAGFYFENKNVLDLQRKLEYLIFNKELVNKLGRLALRRAREEYDWKKIIKKTNFVYKNLEKVYMPVNLTNYIFLKK